jgi:hypothetical protein
MAQGSNTPVATLSITATADEVAAKHTAWDKFAQQQGLPLDEAKQRHTLRKR